MLRPIALITATAALAVAGCGEKSEPEIVAPSGGGGNSASTTTTKTTAGGQGGGNKQKASPEEEVNAAVVAVIGGGDPADVCSGLGTERYVKTAYGDAKGCKAAVDKQGAFSVQVSAIKVDGKQATAKAKPAAGPNKGETITVQLVDEGGTWKVDSAKSNAPAGP